MRKEKGLLDIDMTYLEGKYNEVQEEAKEAAERFKKVSEKKSILQE